MSHTERANRELRRLPVRFRTHGADATEYTGFTTDISTSGAFVATRHVIPSGTRLRLEIGDPGRGFAIEGVVARSRKVAPALHAIGVSGMGVRFLSVEELVREILPSVLRSGETGPPRDGVYTLEFASAEKFFDTLQSEVVHGGLFVPTRHPAALAAPVTVEVRVAPITDQPLRLKARVVQRQEPRVGDDSTNLLAGMGIAFDHPARARAALIELAARATAGEAPEADGVGGE